MEKNRLDPPTELVKHVTGMLDEDGQAWLDELPSLIAELERVWSIDVGEPFPAGEFNYVAPAVRADGTQAVLKISPPFPNNEIRGEAAFLRTQDGRGAVRLYAEDVERRAILIERAIPGRNLAELFSADKCAAIQPAIEVLRSILGPPPDEIEVKYLDEWFAGLERAASTAFPADYVSKALAIYERLSGQSEHNLYLHADFHPGNVVSATREPYLVIDPKGLIGHVGYDIAVFLNNFHWWQETEADVHSKLDAAVREFSAAFEIDTVELREWAYAQMVLGAWWSFDEMPGHYDPATLAKADIWNV